MLDFFTGIIKMMDDFRDDGKEITIKYQLDADYKELCETYKLNEIAGTKSDFDKAVNLLHWISSNTYHYGNYDNHVKNTAMELLQYAFGKGEDCGINCRSLSLALTECLLAIGIKARVVYLMPFSPYDFDNHVVCEAFISEENKWVMIDPTYDLYATANGVHLSIYELRNALANQEEVIYNKEMNYNGEIISNEDISTYYAKDLFRFMVSDIQGSNAEAIDGRRFIEITPCGYDVKQYTLANIDYRIKKWGDSENLQTWRKNAEGNTLIYKGLDLLY